jgi:CHAD domain-containing protein
VSAPVGGSNGSEPHAPRVHEPDGAEVRPASSPPRPPLEVDAHAALAPALREMIDAVRRTAAYVVETGRRRPRPSAKGGGVSEPPPGDAEEAVHDFRVAVRRLRTVLRALRRTYGKRKLRAIGAGLKRYGDATSTLRDEEVLRETLGQLDLAPDVRERVDAWTARRLRQERARRAQVVRLLSAGGDLDVRKDLERELSRIEKLLRRGTRKKKPLGAVAAAATARGHHDLELPLDDAGAVDASALDAADALAMHALRIRFKRLRYTAELFGPLLEAAQAGAPAAPLIEPRELAAYAKDATRMQKRLGELHDVDEALVRIARAWGLDAAARAALAEALRIERARLAARALGELSRWRPVDTRRAEPPA